MNLNAQLIATLITANCEAHLNGQKSRVDWSDEQNRLWLLAAKRCVASEVMRLVCPSLTPLTPDQRDGGARYESQQNAGLDY